MSEVIINRSTTAGSSINKNRVVLSRNEQFCYNSDFVIFFFGFSCFELSSSFSARRFHLHLSGEGGAIVMKLKMVSKKAKTSSDHSNQKSFLAFLCYRDKALNRWNVFD